MPLLQTSQLMTLLLILISGSILLSPMVHQYLIMLYELILLIAAA